MTVRKIVFLVASCLAVALASSSCGSIGTYAVKVNGKAITQRQLDDELDAIAANKKYLDSIDQQLAQQGGKARGTGKGTFDTGFVAQVLRRRILLEIVHQGIVKRHIKITDADRKAADDQLVQQFTQQNAVDILNKFRKSYRKELVERSAEVNALQNALSTTKVTPEAIKQFYDANQSQFTQTCARHILAQEPQDHTPTAADDAAAKAKADAWKARLDKGEDFATIAKAESDDKGSGAQGGDLGCDNSNFDSQFVAAENGLQPNQISAPVKTQFGYHIIQVTSRKVQTLQEATPQITQQLQQASQGVIDDFLTQVLPKTKVNVNPRYGHYQFDEQNGPQVIPPGLPPTTTTTTPGLSPIPGGPSTGGQPAPGASGG